MPDKQVKRWNVYHALRRKGASKRKEARIANTKKKKRKR